VLAVVAVCETAAFGWLQSSIVRFYAHETDEAGRAQLAAAVRLGFGLSALVLSVAWIVALLGLPAFAEGAALGVAGMMVLLCRAWASMGLNWSRVMDQPWRFATALILQSAGAVVFAVIGLTWWTDDPVVLLAAAAMASLLASAVAHVPSSRRPEPLLQLKSRLRQMWTYGAPIAGVSLLFVMLAASDRLLIASLIGPAAAGAYSAASSIAERAISLLLLPIALATKPQIFVEYSQGGAEASRRLLKHQSGWLMAAGLPITTLLVCAPERLASIVVGAQLAGMAAEVLPWTGIAALLSCFLSLHFGLAFQIASRTKGMLFAVAPAVALNVLANIVLLPVFGVVAAGWSTVAGYSTALLLAIRFGSRHLRVPFSFSDMLRTAAACALLAAFLQLEFSHSLVGVVSMLTGAALIYVAAALAFNAAGSRVILLRWLRLNNLV
jgi:O-antigen/teichoic acid export membrane protein